MAAAPPSRSLLSGRGGRTTSPSARFDWLAALLSSLAGTSQNTAQVTLQEPATHDRIVRYSPGLFFHTIGILLRNRNDDSSSQRFSGSGLSSRSTWSGNFSIGIQANVLRRKTKQLGGRGVGESSIAFSVLREIPLPGATRTNSPPSSPSAHAVQSLGSRRREKRTPLLKRRAPAPGTRPCLSSQCFAERSTLLSFPCMLVLRRQSIRHFPA